MLALPAWPDPASPEGRTFFDNAKEIFHAYKIRGKGNPFALGLLAQAEAESSLNPNAKGDHIKGEPTTFGLHQRHRDRLDVIRIRKGIDILGAVLKGENTIKDEIGATLWELETFSYFGKTPIESQKSAYGAAYQACAMFERAGAPDAGARRGGMAERWAAWVAGGASAGPKTAG